jgi:MFS family permease
VRDSTRSRYSFFLINYFVQGCIGIVYEPLNYVLKDRLHLTPGQTSGFIAWMTLPLLLKPVYGWMSDFVPIGGYRRRPHLMIGSLAASLAFGVLAFQTHYRYAGLLYPMMGACLALAFADAACDGLLVEDGQARRLTGPYQALQIGALYASVILSGYGSGWMTSHLAYSWIFAIAGILPLAIFASSFMIHEEGPSRSRPRDPFQFWGFIRTKKFWMLSLTIVLWNFYPFLGTVQFYYQSNVLRLNPQWIGSLMTVGSLAGLVGAAVFWKFCQSHDVRVWVSRGPIVMALVSLSYLFYWGPVSVTVIETLYGFFSVFFRLALLDLVARTCPKDAEATAYAVFLSFFDIAMYGSNALGGKLYDVLQRILAHQAHPVQTSVVVLMLIGSLCTLTCRWTLPALEENTLKTEL